MTPERWKRVDELLSAVLDLDTDKRSAYLNEACAGDESLRREVETLLASDGQPDSFIESPASRLAADLVHEQRQKFSAGGSIGPYQIRSLLGAGGMGEVYRARDPRIGREVAIKILPSHFSQEPDRIRRFEQEARAAGLLNHPNILAIYDAGTDRGSPYLVSELLHGELLRQKLKGNPLSVRKAIDYSLQIANGLTAAHEKGIVHRDLKPENVFITKEGRVKILDFGLAKLTDPEPSAGQFNPGAVDHQTDTGVVVGTVQYMSPEQVRGSKVDHRSDIFAFGSVLYEMLSGKRPFHGDSQIEVMHAVLKEDPPELSKNNPDIPPELERIVRRCLEKDPNHRFQSTNDLAFALEGFSTTSSSAQIVSKAPGRNVGKKIVIAAAVVILFAATFIVYRNRVLRTESSPQRSEPFHRMQISALTTTGKIFDAAISPDGNYVAYVVKDGDLQSLRVRQVATTSNVPIVPPAPVRFQGITFSRDGNFIYYVVSPLDNPRGTVYRIPVLGEESRKLLDDVYGPVAVSPDNTSLAFLGTSGLMISLTDGNSVQTLAEPSPGNAFEGSPAWSPDGKTIVVIADDLAGYRDNLIAIDVESRKQTAIVSTKWFDIDRLDWLSDGDGFVLVAKEDTTGYRNYQIWFVSYPKGEVSRITNDLNEYRGLSLTSDSSTIISVRLEQNSNIWVIPSQNSTPQQITYGSGSLDGLWGISWTTDGRIVYTSTASGDEDLWLMTPEGRNAKQLTTGKIAKIAPSCCPDGKYAVFMSRNSEGTHIWRIGMDGSGMKQLTYGASEGIPNCIGRDVVYVSPGSGSWSLWKVSIDGGESVQLTDKPSLSPVVSPDGKWIAFAFLDESKQKNMGIISTEGGLPIKTLPLSPTVLVDIGLGLRWTSDARAITYIDVVDGVSNIWIQPLDGGQPKQRTSFQSGEIFSYDVSRNGEIAVTHGTSARDVVLIKDFAETLRN